MPSFGHVHDEGFVPTSSVVSSLFDQATNSHLVSPRILRHHLKTQDMVICVICACTVSVGLLAFTAAAPLPSATIAGELALGRTETRLTASFNIHFGARAPPVA
jgi:hypothetical protein